MIRSKTLALGLMAMGSAFAMLSGQSAWAGNGHGNGNGHKSSTGSHNSHNSHNHNNHNSHSNHNNHSHNNHNNFNHHNFNHHNFNHNIHFGNGGSYKPHSPRVTVVFCVVVRQPDRYHDHNFHQVKCFHSEYEAKAFAASLHAKFQADSGFAVRVDRRVG